MKVPPKPKRGKRSPFYWWRRWKTHKCLPAKAGLLARIQNGDFEYTKLFEWAEYELHYMQDELNEFVKNYQGFDNPETDTQYLDIQKRYRKRYNKLREDAHETEINCLNKLIDELKKEFIITKEELWEIMETFGDTTERLYLHVAEVSDGFRRPNKNKIVQLLKARI